MKSIIDELEDLREQHIMKTYTHWKRLQPTVQISMKQLTALIKRGRAAEYINRNCGYLERGHCNLWAIGRRPSEAKLRKELKDMAQEWVNRCNTDLQYAGHAIKRALSHNPYKPRRRK